MIYLAAEKQDGKLVSDDGQMILQGTELSVQQNGVLKNYIMNETQPAVYTDDSGTYIIIDTSAGKAYLSDSVKEFLNKVNEYYGKQEKLEEMYRCNYFAYRDIKNYVRKVSDWKRRGNRSLSNFTFLLWENAAPVGRVAEFM